MRRSGLVVVAVCAAFAASCGGGSGGGASGNATTVHPGESIQAAVDAASPGDTIEVLPGDYVERGTGEAAVRIRKSLKLVGNSGAGMASAWCASCPAADSATAFSSRR